MRKFECATIFREINDLIQHVYPQKMTTFIIFTHVYEIWVLNFEKIKTLIKNAENLGFRR